MLENVSRGGEERERSAAKLIPARGELLAWLNDLLAPNHIQKIEECGKGDVYCMVGGAVTV